MKPRALFDKLAQAYATTTPPLATSPDDLFSWLRSFVVHTDQGSLTRRMLRFSRSPLSSAIWSKSTCTSGRQGSSRAQDRGARPPEKVSHSTTVIPAEGMTSCNVTRASSSPSCSVCSASRPMRTGAKGAARGSLCRQTLSRLHRFCDKHPAGRNRL